MTKGPSNALIAKRRAELLEQKSMPPLETIREWRAPPDAREYARRYQVFELLQWYHHEVYLPDRGLRGALRRFWNWIRGHKVKNLSVWEQLRIRDQAEAHQATLTELRAKTEAELARLEAELEREE